MNAPRPLLDLVAEVVRAHPLAHLEWQPLPSGVSFFWASLGERNFVIEYNPRGETGVSENTPESTPFDGHDRVFAKVDEAVAHFKQLLADAVIHPKLMRAPVGAA